MTPGLGPGVAGRAQRTRVGAPGFPHRKGEGPKSLRAFVCLGRESRSAIPSAFCETPHFFPPANVIRLSTV